jgi:protein tyrosine phosphatase (PTP) superfamily phosphohydrolase (DUF442 family)
MDINAFLQISEQLGTAGQPLAEDFPQIKATGFKATGYTTDKVIVVARSL